MGGTTGLDFFVSAEGFVFWVPAIAAAVLIPSGRHLLAASQSG